MMNLRRYVALASGAMSLFIGCATHNKMQAVRVPAGSLRLTQVMAFATREQILANHTLYNMLTASGISDGEIKDGSVVVGRVECCKGPNELSSAVWAYVSPGTTPELGDTVEVRSGGVSSSQGPGSLNVVTRVVQRGTGPCRWEPPEEYLWQRILYCDWMPEQGWVLHKADLGLWKYWVKEINSTAR